MYAHSVQICLCIYIYMYIDTHFCYKQSISIGSSEQYNTHDIMSYIMCHICKHVLTSHYIDTIYRSISKSRYNGVRNKIPTLYQIIISFPDSNVHFGWANPYIIFVVYPIIFP
jgi:hypothetical protein